MQKITDSTVCLSASDGSTLALAAARLGAKVRAKILGSSPGCSVEFLYFTKSLLCNYPHKTEISETWKIVSVKQC